MVTDCVVRRHSRSVLQKSCSTVSACFRTFQGIGRGSSADGHGIGQVACVDHAVAVCVFNAVFRSVGEPVVGGHRSVSARHSLGAVEEVVGERQVCPSVGRRVAVGLVCERSTQHRAAVLPI